MWAFVHFVGLFENVQNNDKEGQGPPQGSEWNHQQYGRAELPGSVCTPANSAEENRPQSGRWVSGSLGYRSTSGKAAAGLIGPAFPGKWQV